ncbi:MAG TPA: DNA mismatch repair protein MutS [Anaerohalosphaeraceae bacterium]|jgi:DNA mismatch repair protein MutS|nr:DNA mismatch repair protein MutS [Anaerohalosphaeraceae bacterium]HRT50032.1 DNA mismatch repair protein MutS [Anaerohalosphaeraceae bacterium]HRT85835.1 DNA mismatch repair protein MutS [Anaerohalosphaeraceae bacterium]
MAKSDDNLTPAMRQFHHFKQKYPDAILFFRMGDFYETFYEDAQICSRVLGLTLTSRSKADNPIPLAGVPYHAVDGYLKKMIQAGYKVAVCEQIEDPRTAKGVVKRDVVRIVTPGTLTDDMLLDARQDNFLAAVHLAAKVSLAWVDVSTGHFFVRTVADDAILDELLRIGPREVLLPQTRGELFAEETKKLSDDIRKITGAVVTERPAWYFDPHTTKSRLLKHFGTATLEGFGIDDNFPAIGAAGAVLEYLNETQKTALGHITSIKELTQSRFLQIDPTSLRSLEVLRTLRSESTRGSLLDAIDHTLTGMGSRMIRSWLCMPLCERDRIELRQDAVAELVENDDLTARIRDSLSNIADLERILARISTLRASPRDLLALGATLRTIPALGKLLTDCQSSLNHQLGLACDPIEELADLLEAAIRPDCPPHVRDGGVIRPGFSEELDRLHAVSTDGRSWLARFQQQQIERTGIPNLKVGFNKVFGYYIELPRSAADKAPADYVRKQTVKNAERYITDELKRYEEEALGAAEKAVELEQKLFEQLRAEAAKHTSRLQSLAAAIANADCIAAFAHVARRRGYIRPTITDDMTLVIREGKHPVLAETLGSEFVPNDIALADGSGDLAIITGPNMAGKSTYIRQVALLVILAQTGSFIPAAEATIGIVDRLFTRVGASDEIVRGRSTFMVEMTETADILHNATPRSLVILDEVGRGTSTYDGLSLAWAITEHIANHIRCRTLFATHYHELTELAELLANVKNLNVAVREWADEVIFLHKILPGGTDKSYGIHVAKLAGVPKPILARSAEILADLENTFAREARTDKLTPNRTKPNDTDLLFIQKHKSILEKLKDTDPNQLTPIQAINLLEQIKKELQS